MKLKYDNLEDAKIKLHNTYCLYKGRAIVVRGIEPEVPGSLQFIVHGTYMATGRPMNCLVEDPEFNCSNYNIGYINRQTAAAWFYRIPFKQYRQGLRHDQVKMKFSRRSFAEIQFQSGKPLCNMLENSYPTLKDSAKLLQDQEALIMAFHKNFAMTLDHIHGDFILEYKGSKIGFTKDLKSFQLTDENSHLHESLKEAISG